MDPDELMQRAKEAVCQAYAPYSNFKVGAALLTESGKTYAGCNIENAAYGLTICAERLAVFKAVADGEKPKELAIFADTGYSQPCGQCRQTFIEFNINMNIYYLRDGQVVNSRARDLLPDFFTARSMELD